MSKFFLKHKKFILTACMVVLVSSLGIFIFEIKEANAFSWLFGYDSIKDMFIGMFSTILYYIVFRPLSLVLSIAGYLLDWAFGLQTFTDVPIVQEGWTITRDLANMFFVLILLVIAMATILKIETYGMKSLLPKLIAVALLINFSLVFCGVVIDSSQILTSFFLDPLTNSGASISENVANGLNIMQIFEKGEAEGIDALNVLIGIMGGIVVILFAGFIMAAAAFFLIVRVVAIWILLVLVPIALLAIVLPATKHLWNQWAQSFIKWVFFAPAFAFFFYLAILTITGADGQGGFLSRMGNSIELGENEAWSSAFFSSQELILEYIFLILLLAGGLVVAQKMSITFAGGTMDLAKKASKGSARWMGRRAQMATAPIAGKLGEKLQKTRFGKMPGIRQTIRPLRAISENQRTQLSDAKKKYSSWTNENIDAEMRAANPRNKAAMLAIKAERGQIKGGYAENEGNLKTFERMGGNLDDVFEKRPDLLGKYEVNAKGTDPVKAADKLREMIYGLTPTKAGKVQAESYSDPGVQKVFRDAMGKNGPLGATHISSIAMNNPKAKKAMDEEIFNPSGPHVQYIKKEIIDWLENSPGNVQFYTNPETQTASTPPPTPPK